MVRNYVRKREGPKWSKLELDEAVEEVKSARMSGYEAAARFKIPRTTIMSHVNGLRGQKSDSMGRPKALSAEHEQKLADCLHVMEKNGFGLSRTETMELVQTFVRENKLITPFNDDKPGQEWFKNFCGRHKLSIKKPQLVEISRKRAADPFIFEKYFDLLFATIYELNLEDKPHRIWNIDETSFVSDPKKTKIVGLKGFASTRTTATAGKDNTTVLFSSNAAGGKGPPFIIYKGKNTWSEWTSEDAYPGTVYTATENGWIETKAFEEFISKSFIPMLGPTSEPTLLIYDGHSTHVQPSVLEIAKKHNITIIKLPPHSSHLLQPLDLSVFKAFKDKWDSVMVKWQRSNYGQKLTKKEFAVHVGKVWKDLDRLNIINGFKKGGIYPLNRDAVPKDRFDPIALKRWETMKAESNSTINNGGTLKNFPTTSCAGTKSIFPTLSSLSLRHVMMSIQSAHTPKVNNTIQQSIENFSQSSIIECSTKTVEKSFEELLLNSIKQHERVATTTKKTRIAGGAEVITHVDVINRLKKKEEEKQMKSKKRKPTESSLTQKINTKASKKKVLQTIDDLQRLQASPVPSTSKSSTMNSQKESSKKITVTEDNFIKSGDIKVRHYNKENNVKIQKNTALIVTKKKITKNANTLLKEIKKQNTMDIKEEKGLGKKKTTKIDSSSDDSNYSVHDSDMSDYDISDDVAKLCARIPNNEEDEDLDQVSCSLTDIKYFTGSAPKYNTNDWVLVKFCTKKSIKHFVGQIMLYHDTRPTIKYVRKVRSAKKESIFTFPINDDICELKHPEDIIAVLPAPEISRRGHFIFKIKFDDYNMQ